MYHFVDQIYEEAVEGHFHNTRWSIKLYRIPRFQMATPFSWWLVSQQTLAVDTVTSQLLLSTRLDGFDCCCTRKLTEKAIFSLVFIAKLISSDTIPRYKTQEHKQVHVRRQQPCRQVLTTLRAYLPVKLSRVNDIISFVGEGLGSIVHESID